MSDDYSSAFTKMVKDAGLPTTEDEAKAQWQALAVAENLPYNNKAEISPFWRGITALVTTPVLWIVKELLLKQILPNMFLRTATGVWLNMFGWAVDLEIKAAKKAKGNLLFSRVNTVGDLVIPANTIVKSPLINGRSYHLKTLATAIIADGVASISVAAEAVEAGEGYNLPAGYYAILQVPIAGINAVTNSADWLTSAGADEESPDDYRMRIRNQVTAVNQFHTDAVYLKIITTFANINTRNVFFEHGAPRGPGTANAYILMDVGQPSSELIAEIESHVMDAGNHGHGDDLRIFAMPETEHDFTVTIRAVPSATVEEKAELLNGVTNAIGAAFRANNEYAMTVTQPLSRFSFSLLGAELHRLFPLLHSVQFSLSEIISALNIPRMGEVTVQYDD